MVTRVLQYYVNNFVSFVDVIDFATEIDNSVFSVENIGTRSSSSNGWCSQEVWKCATYVVS